jgi:hypothetical protein
MQKKKVHVFFSLYHRVYLANVIPYHDEFYLYSEKYMISGDYDFLIRLINSNKFKIKSTNKFHNIMRLGGDSTNISKIFLKLKEDYLIIKKHNLNIFTLAFKILSKITQINKNKKIDNNYIKKFN